MLARYNIGKLHTCAVLVAVSLLGSLFSPASVAPVQKTYDNVDARQNARQQQLSSTVRYSIEAMQSEKERSNAPRRLDLLKGASGQPIHANGIFTLASEIGYGFGKLVADKEGFGLEIKEPASTWRRIPEVRFDKSLVLMRHGKRCVRLEDPVEPTANYYAICMMPEGITIHTVGELESFS